MGTCIPGRTTNIMIAKVAVFFAALAAVHATGLVGYGAPLLAGGHLGTISAQSTAINHVAPAAPLAYGGALGYGHGLAAPLGVAGLGIGPLGIAGHGVGPLGLGHGLAAGNVRADGLVGAGIVGSRYGGVIAHNAVGHGLGGVHYGGLLGLGHGVGLGKAVW